MLSHRPILAGAALLALGLAALPASAGPKVPAQNLPANALPKPSLAPETPAAIPIGPQMPDALRGQLDRIREASEVARAMAMLEEFENMAALDNALGAMPEGPDCGDPIGAAQARLNGRDCGDAAGASDHGGQGGGPRRGFAPAGMGPDHSAEDARARAEDMMDFGNRTQSRGRPVRDNPSNAIADPRSLAANGGACGRIPSSYGTVGGCSTDRNGTTRAHGQRDGTTRTDGSRSSEGHENWEVERSDNAFFVNAEQYDENGNKTGEFTQDTQEYGGYSRTVREWRDADGEVIRREETVERTDPDADGPAGQPDPNGDNDVSLAEFCAWTPGALGCSPGDYEPNEIDRRNDERRRMLQRFGRNWTIKDRWDAISQPVPTDGVAAAQAEDPRAIAGFTPECATNPEGCGGAGLDALSGHSATAALGVADPRGIAGFTPECATDPEGCGGR